MSQNETKRHFELRNLEEDMKTAHQEAYRVVTKEQSKRSARQIQFLVAALIGVVVLLIWLLGGF